MATEVTLAHHVEKAGENTSDVDCVTYHAIVLDSVLCQVTEACKASERDPRAYYLFFEYAVLHNRP